MSLYDRTGTQTRVNARLTLSDIPVSQGNLSVAAWVRNLNNEEHREWGIDFNNHPRGGVTGVEPVVAKADREIWLLQRKVTPVGRGLGLTTGWTHRLSLARRGVKMLNAVEYVKIDDAGLHIRREEKTEILHVDTIVICAGQQSERSLFDTLRDSDLPVELIGGAYKAAELDAKTAIKQASYLAAEV
jgi:2,4-dienoyl-CoA reductase (NADPH2)